MIGGRHMRKYKRVCISEEISRQKRMTLFRGLERIAGKVYQLVA
jgi:hypothetical protein